MDPIENKLQEYYQNKKRVDAKSTPDFETMWNKPGTQKSPQRDYTYHRIAAAITAALIVVTGYLYFHGPRTPANDHQLSAIDLHEPMTLKLLNYKTFAPEYIWTWKAPTDKLLDNVNQSLNKSRNGKF